MPFPTTDTEHLHASNLFASRTFIDTTAALTGLDDTPSPASSFGGPLEPQPTIDISGFLSALDSSPWRATAGALYINNTGVHLHGSTAPAVRTSLPTHVSPSLARTHPFIPLLPLELADLLLSSVANLTLVDPGLMLTPIQPSSSFCARAFAGLALLSLVKVTEPVIDGNPIGTCITAQTLLSLTRAYSDLTLDLEFAAAQQLANVAYRNATEHAVFDFDGVGVSWTDDRAMAVAGFVYLAVRSVSDLILFCPHRV